MVKNKETQKDEVGGYVVVLTDEGVEIFPVCSVLDSDVENFLSQKFSLSNIQFMVYENPSVKVHTRIVGTEEDE